MNKIKINYCNEDLKYKVFGLFPYFDKDANNNLVLYKGDTAVDGCFNKLSCAFTLPKGINLEIDGKKLVSEFNTYNYKTLSYYYNKYKDTIRRNSFIDWMDRGIGRIKVTLNLDLEEYDLVPEFVNISECKNLYDEMYKKKILCDRYIAQKEIDGIINCDLECLVNQYNRMGGDMLLNFYKEKVELSQEISDEYFQYANIDKSYYSINLSITNSFHDLGCVESYIYPWSYKERYYCGDIVTYNGLSYICDGDFIDGKDNGVGAIWSDDEQRYILDITKFSTVQQIISHQSPHQELEQEYKQLMLGDNDVQLSGITNSKLNTFRRYVDYISPFNNIEKPGLNEDWLFYYRKGYLSHYETSLDINGNVAMIEGFTREEPVAGQDIYEKHLMAYGDILQDITYDTSKHTITFKYIIGAHLKALITQVDINELMVPKYFYSDYEYDSDDIYHGVVYEETYEYAVGSDLDLLISGVQQKGSWVGRFDDYINGVTIPGTEFIKFEFDLRNSVSNSHAVINGQTIEFSYIPTNFSANVSKQRDFMVAPIIRPEYYDSVTYTPHIINNVRFTRGNAAAFERHIKLGEIKSFDDFINYSNNGFFNVI